MQVDKAPRLLEPLEEAEQSTATVRRDASRVEACYYVRYAAADIFVAFYYPYPDISSIGHWRKRRRRRRCCGKK